MSNIATKLTYLNGTKQAIKQAINEDFEVIYDKGKNLFDGVLELGNFNTNTGEKVANNNYIINTNPIPVEELTNYKISSNGTGIGVYIFEYKEDLTFNLSSRKTINADSYLTTNSGTKYINFRTIDVNTNLQEKIQVEKGSTATNYEPYVEETTFREYADEISSNNAKYKDLIPKETTNATNTLDISNSSGLDKTLVTQYGNTYQETTTGKNLFKASSSNYPQGLNITYDSDKGTITFSGTTTGTYPTLSNFTEANIPAGTYTFSIDKALPYNLSCRFRNSSGQYPSTVILSAGELSKSITLSYDTVRLELVYSVTEVGVTIPTTTIKPMMELGSTATNWEKYSGGNPAPNPDYPQEIVNISGKSNVKVVGKNLFDNVYGQTEKVYTKHINAPSPLGSVDCYPINLLPNTQYTLKIDMNGYKKTGAWIAGVCFENGDVISLLQLNSMADITTTTFTTDSTGVVYVGQRYGFTYGETGRMDLFLQTAKIQLKQGTTASEYQPYQEQSFNLDLKSKNLWGEEEHGGIDESTGQDTYNANRWRTIKYIKVTHNTSYTLSSNASSNIWYVFYYYDKSKNFISSKALAGTTSVNWTTPSNCEYMRCVVGDTATIKTTERQLELGSTATEYEPYYDINLCKIGDYQDRIYPLNGKWYLEKKIGKVVFDGSEGWYGGSNSSFVSVIEDMNSVTLNSDDFYCSHLKNVATIGTSGTATHYANRIYVYYSAVANAGAFKTWLSSNNMTLYYILATQTTEEITESNYPTLYNQLNNIKLFEGVNHITMTNESGLDVEFDIEYYKDWKLD